MQCPLSARCGRTTGAVLDAEALTPIGVTEAVGWKLLDLGWADVTVASVYKRPARAARHRLRVGEFADRDSIYGLDGAAVEARG